MKDIEIEESLDKIVLLSWCKVEIGTYRLEWELRDLAGWRLLFEWDALPCKGVLQSSQDDQFRRQEYAKRPIVNRKNSRQLK